MLSMLVVKTLSFLLAKWYFKHYLDYLDVGNGKERC